MSRIVMRFCAQMMAIFAFLASGVVYAECGMTGSATGATFWYDPFNPTGTSLTQINMTLTRRNDPGADRTNTVDFYIKAANSSANGTAIVVDLVTGQVNVTGQGSDIFYNSNETPPNLTQAITSTNAYVHVDFTGANEGSDVINVSMTVTLPTNLNLSASNSNLSFDLVYNCTGGTGQGNNSYTSTGIVNPSSITFPVRVLSALRASWQGPLAGTVPTLDFGELGTTQTSTVISNQPAWTRSGNVLVQSSSAYSVTMSSQNGYQMTYLASGVPAANQRLWYKANFVGLTRGHTLTAPGGSPTSNLTTLSKTCQRGNGIAGNTHPLEVVLQEGGLNNTTNVNKLVSPNYSDTINVTIAPEVASVVGTTC